MHRPNAGINQQWTAVAWSRAKRQAASRTSEGTNVCVEPFTKLQAPQGLQVWSLAVELYLVQLRPIPPKQVALQLGRGAPPAMVAAAHVPQTIGYLQVYP